MKQARRLSSLVVAELAPPDGEQCHRTARHVDELALVPNPCHLLAERVLAAEGKPTVPVSTTGASPVVRSGRSTTSSAPRAAGGWGPVDCGAQLQCLIVDLGERHGVHVAFYIRL